MKGILANLRGAIAATLVLTVVCCGLYPLLVFGVGQALFRDQANGSLIVDRTGVVRGSRLIGQNFSGERYFHPRPSAAGANGYDAAGSGGSNLGPTSRKLSDAIQARVAAYRKTNGLPEAEPVPADAVTASGSGLDPHISPRNAELQAPRVAKARGIELARLQSLIAENTQPPSLGVFGDAAVNVVQLNLALDGL